MYTSVSKGSAAMAEDAAERHQAEAARLRAEIEQLVQRALWPSCVGLEWSSNLLVT